MTGSEPRRGMVLVIALWTIALCSALAMATSVTFRSFVGIAGIDRDRIQGDALLSAGLEVAAGLASGWQEKPLLDRETSFDLSGGTVRVRINDEGGRIDVGKAPSEFLASLLFSVGVPKSQADNLAQAIVEWRSGDEQQPQNAGMPKTPTDDSNNSLFTNVDQIAEVPGMRPEWVAAIRPLTTVFGAETVNPLTAPPGVIAAVPGVDRDRLEAFLAARRSLPNDADQLGAMLGSGQVFVAAKPQKVVSVRLAARLAGGYATAARAVIVLLSNDKEPYRVLVWTPLSASTVL